MANPTNFNVFTWRDEGAPQYTNTGTLTAQANSTLVGAQILDILDKCLVGNTAGIAYASKTAAGWTKPYQSGAYHVYKQGANSSEGYLQIRDLGATGYINVAVDFFESMSSVTQGTNSIYGRSPVKPFANGWRIGNTQSGGYGAADHGIPWMVIANSAVFYFIKPGYQVALNAGTGGIASYINWLSIVGAGDFITYSGMSRRFLCIDEWETSYTLNDIPYTRDLTARLYNIGSNGNLDTSFTYISNVPNIPYNQPTTTIMGDTRFRNNGILVSSGFSTFNGSGATAQIYPHAGPNNIFNKRHLEKVFVACRSLGIGGANSVDIIGELPGVYRVTVPHDFIGIDATKDYIYVNQGEPGYTACKTAAVFFKRDGDWYGNPDFVL